MSFPQNSEARSNLQAIIRCTQLAYMGFPGGSEGKESVCNVGNPGSIPESRRCPGEGNSYPLLYSCLENPMDRGAWRAPVDGATKSRTRLSDQARTQTVQHPPTRCHTQQGSEADTDWHGFRVECLNGLPAGPR